MSVDYITPVIDGVVNVLDILASVSITWNGHTISILNAILSFIIFVKILSCFLAGFTALTGSDNFGGDE